MKQSALRTAAAGLIGNVLEWFDFAVYGYFATDIGKQFFPESNPAPLVSTWLLGRFHNPFLPAYYVMLFGVIGLAIMVPMAETNGRSLDE